jgi:hypothetical protein
MLNKQVKDRLLALDLKGADLVELFEGMIKVAKGTNATNSAIALNYADENVQPGEYVAEIHLIVQKVSENED